MTFCEESRRNQGEFPPNCIPHHRWSKSSSTNLKVQLWMLHTTKRSNMACKEISVQQSLWKLSLGAAWLQKSNCTIHACHYGFSPTNTNQPTKSTTTRARQDVWQDTTEFKSLSSPSQAQELATIPPPPVDSATITCTGIRHKLLSFLYGNPGGGGGAITPQYVFNWMRVNAVNAGVSFPKSLG